MRLISPSLPTRRAWLPDLLRLSYLSAPDRPALTYLSLPTNPSLTYPSLLYRSCRKLLGSKANATPNRPFLSNLPSLTFPPKQPLPP